MCVRSLFVSQADGQSKCRNCYHPKPQAKSGASDSGASHARQITICIKPPRYILLKSVRILLVHSTSIILQVDLSPTTGMSSHVRPSNILPNFFFQTPPHCLKKNGTPEPRH